MPDRPPMTNMLTNASALSIGTVKRMLPPQSVPSQLKVLMALRHGDEHRADGEGRAERRVHAALEHVMRPDDEPEERDARDRVDHRAVAEDRLAGERREDVADHSHRRQDHDVDGRVGIEPEQVLVQQRESAAGVRVDRLADDVAERLS